MSKFNIGDKVICRYWLQLEVIGCKGTIKSIEHDTYEVESLEGKKFSSWWGERCLELAESPEFKGSIEFEVNV